MFLVKDEIYHEVAWMLWLEQAAGVAPGEALAGTSNDSLAACAADGPWRNASAAAGLHPAVAGQNLFTLYVHTHADHDGPAPGSLFYGAVLPREQRIATTWGGHSLVTATKALLRAALSEPLNAKLLLISETTVPIYSPHLLYRQVRDGLPRGVEGTRAGRGGAALAGSGPLGRPHFPPPPLACGACMHAQRIGAGHRRAFCLAAAAVEPKEHAERLQRIGVEPGRGPARDARL